MNINRHNYETFFLLYTDNELSVAERKAVDEFVEANPDLQEELVVLQQSILKPDDIVFDNKNSLLRNEFVSGDLQEKLLLHLDNELTTTEKKEIDALIRSNGEIKKEWEILQQTKLMGNEVIVFKDKTSLYRREGGRVIAFPWRRVAAAAILIGFIIGGGAIYLNRGTEVKVSGNETVKVTPPTTIPDKIKSPVDQPIAPVVSPTVKDEPIASAEPNNKKSSTAVTVKSPKKIESRRINNDDAQPLAMEKTNNLPKPSSENLNKIKSNETLPAYVTTEKQATNIVNPGNNAMDKNTGNNDAANEFATRASITDNSEDNNNNRVLFMNEEKIKKTKLGGIFRKVKRVFERNTNIKGSDNNIKVANLEFAIQ